MSEQTSEEHECATCGRYLYVPDYRDWEDGASCWDCTIAIQAKRIEELEAMQPTWKPKPDAPGWWLYVGRQGERRCYIRKVDRPAESGSMWFGPIPALPETGKE